MDTVTPIRDVPVIISSPAATSERRITPSWTVAQFKRKLEPITGIPPSCQKISLKNGVGAFFSIESVNDTNVQLTSWNLQPYAEVQVDDARPSGAVNLAFADVNSVARYTMPKETYEALPSSVLAWKKANKLGRFDPSVSGTEVEMVQKMWNEAVEKGIEIGKRCQLGANSLRRGSVAFVGEVPDIPGTKGPWVGVILDEPTGKNNGSVNGRVYFKCENRRGIFVRPERVDVGEYGVLEDEINEDLEEI